MQRTTPRTIPRTFEAIYFAQRITLIISMAMGT
jgi:hypothetical protein